MMTSEYGEKLRKGGNGDVFAKIQEQWLKDLEDYLATNSKTFDGPEAMLQLANGLELKGEETKALEWYDRLIAESPQSASGIKGKGAKTRLECVGKSIELKGKSISGADISLAKYKGKSVLIHYWAAEYEACQTDLPVLEALAAKYGKSFAIIGVSLDNDRKTLANYLKQNSLPWEQIYEGGGLDSRLANEMGVLTLPTMILVDKHGKVIDRNMHAAQLESELRKMNLSEEAAGLKKVPMR